MAMYKINLLFITIILSLLFGCATNFNVDPKMILATPCDDQSKCAYNYTLASRLGQILELAEKLYGDRDHSYTILGIYFTTNAQPSHWFPGNRKDIIILLTKRCATDEREALFELSHEAIHLLSPTSGLNATNFEEGLATYFSIWYVNHALRQPTTAAYIGSPKYLEVYNDIV
jgi:hypothetical protein